MKRLLILLLLPLATLAQTGYTIKGNIKGLKDSTLVFLQNAQGNTIAQDYAQKGMFTLKGKLDDANIHLLNFIGYKDNVELYMGNETITVSGEANKLKSALILGSKLNADYAYYLQGFIPLREKLNALVASINKEQPGAKRDSLINQFTLTRSKVVDQVNKFTKEKSASPVSAFVLYVVNPLFESPAVLEAKYNALQAPAKKGVYAKLIEQLVADTKKPKAGELGSAAVDFTQNDTANIPVKLSQFKGKYVLVDFWASWCRPCRMENPNVVEAYKTYKDKNFTVLGVSLDQDKANWVKAINDDKLTWTHVSDLKYWSNEVARLYEIQSIPANMLIDPDGKIIGKNLRGEELLGKLKELLK